MMLSKADFEDLFPHIFPSDPAPAARQELADRPPQNAALGSRSVQPVEQAFGSSWPALMIAGAMAASLPIVAANDAARVSKRASGHR